VLCALYFPIFSLVLKRGATGTWIGDINLLAVMKTRNYFSRSATQVPPWPKSKRRRRFAIAALLKSRVWLGLLKVVKMPEFGEVSLKMNVERLNVERLVIALA
jgi:hypothetical protein